MRSFRALVTVSSFANLAFCDDCEGLKKSRSYYE